MISRSVKLATILPLLVFLMTSSVLSRCISASRIGERLTRKVFSRCEYMKNDFVKSRGFGPILHHLISVLSLLSAYSVHTLLRRHARLGCVKLFFESTRRRRTRGGGPDDPVDRESPAAGDRSDRQGKRCPHILPESTGQGGRGPLFYIFLFSAWAATWIRSQDPPLIDNNYYIN